VVLARAVRARPEPVDWLLVRRRNKEPGADGPEMPLLREALDVPLQLFDSTVHALFQVSRGVAVKRIVEVAEVSRNDTADPRERQGDCNWEYSLHVSRNGQRRGERGRRPSRARICTQVSPAALRSTEKLDKALIF